MICHECVMRGAQRSAVALCQFCNVGLCKPHLVALYENPPSFPQYGCCHDRAAHPTARSAASGEGEPEPMPAWAEKLFTRQAHR